ncbi:MAG: AraC family transcriptional regulator [Candidatus Binatia bacterium]|nr:AraC family transcriptional regulator [Candidatus Binatia bacterium]
MDFLSDILKSARLTAKTYLTSAGEGPWCAQIQYRPQGVFHAVLQGGCYLREGGGSEAIALKAGDVIAFPTGGDHKLSGSVEGLKLPGENVIRLPDDDDVMVLKRGTVSFAPPERVEDPHEATRWLSGTMSYDNSIDHPMLKNLPCFIHVRRGSEDSQEILAGLVNLMVATSHSDGAGSALTIDRLTEILFLQLLRSHVQNTGRAEGYFLAVADPCIGVALNMIHAKDDGSLTVELICAAAGMSRTRFNARFTELVGETPKAYLTHTRLLRAKMMLQASRQPIAMIAEATGYSSESSFSKAIKKHFGRTPGGLRKEDS